MNYWLRLENYLTLVNTINWMDSELYRVNLKFDICALEPESQSNPVREVGLFDFQECHIENAFGVSVKITHA